MLGWARDEKMSAVGREKHDECRGATKRMPRAWFIGKKREAHGKLYEEKKN
jgi:hypothetical protein